MKKLLILFLSLFLFATQANAFALGYLVKKSSERVPTKEKERLKKEFFKAFNTKPTPKPQAQKKR